MSKFPDLSKPYVILEEDYDHLYDPTEEEIRKEAIWMGMDPEKEKNLLWIARDALRVFLSYKTWSYAIGSIARAMEAMSNQGIESNILLEPGDGGYDMGPSVRRLLQADL